MRSIYLVYQKVRVCFHDKMGLFYFILFYLRFQLKYPHLFTHSEKWFCIKQIFRFWHLFKVTTHWITNKIFPLKVNLIAVLMRFFNRNKITTTLLLCCSLSFCLSIRLIQEDFELCFFLFIRILYQAVKCIIFFKSFLIYYFEIIRDPCRISWSFLQ